MGTVLLKDLSTGITSSEIHKIYILNATTALIIADANNLGYELWKTDGTSNGTQLVKDINVGSNSGISVFSNTTPTVFNNHLFFSADDGVNGTELWKSDGTEAGTVLVKNINTDPMIENGNGIFGGITSINNKLVFEAFDALHNRELWVSDGTETGTTILKDINLGIGWGAYLDGLVSLNNTLFFVGSNGTNGFELWKTDATATNTVMVKNLENSSSSSNPKKLTAALNKFFFVADSTSFGNQRLFVSDGTTNGTKKVTNGVKTVIGPSNLIEYQNNLYFTSSDYEKDYGIFYTNSEGNQINLVAKINQNGFSNIQEFFYSPTLDALLFGANDGTNGKELWMLKNNNVSLLKDLEAGADSGSPQYFIEFNGEIYFMSIKQQGIGFSRTYKNILWKTDGTTNGTIKLKEFDAVNTIIIPYFTSYNNKLYFAAYDISIGGNYLWSTDGTVSGTAVENLVANTINNIFVIGNNMFYVGSSFGEGQELWKFDGANATLLKSFINGSTGGFSPLYNNNKVINNYYYFSVFENGTSSLWSFDGTDTGFTKILNSYSYLDSLVEAGGYAYLSLDEGNFGTELWRTNGTLNGTVLVEDFYSGEDVFGSKNSASPNNFVLYNNDLFFSANSQMYGYELFKLENAVLNSEDYSVNTIQSSMNVFPNPATSIVTIKSEEAIGNIELFSILGKKIAIQKTNNQNNIQINVSTIKPGIYLLKASINNKTITKKLVIQY